MKWIIVLALVSIAIISGCTNANLELHSNDNQNMPSDNNSVLPSNTDNTALGNISCIPMERICEGTNWKMCHQNGTGWYELNCTYGCTDGICDGCRTNEDCDDINSCTRDSCYSSTFFRTCLHEEIIPCPSEGQICTPGFKKCNNDDVEECNSEGTNFSIIESCSLSCTSGRCIDCSDASFMLRKAQYDSYNETLQLTIYNIGKRNLTLNISLNYSSQLVSTAPISIQSDMFDLFYIPNVSLNLMGIIIEANECPGLIETMNYNYIEGIGY